MKWFKSKKSLKNTNTSIDISIGQKWKDKIWGEDVIEIVAISLEKTRIRYKWKIMVLGGEVVHCTSDTTHIYEMPTSQLHDEYILI